MIAICLPVLQGMMSATASLGLILLWDVDAGLSQIDKYLYATEDFIKVCVLYVYGGQQGVMKTAKHSYSVS